MLAAVYCRVSTAGQAENGTSLESQRDECLKVARERGFDVRPEDIFLEDWTGADLDRPGLERVRELVREQEVHGLVCYSVDRLARNPIHVGIVAEECAKREADLVFVLEPLDNSPEGALIRYVKGYAAQIERHRIKERTLRGKRSRARMGFMVQATGKGIYGYRYVSEAKKRVIYEPEAHNVRRIFDRCIRAESCYSIAVGLNNDGIPAFSGGMWHPLTVKRILTNPSFQGRTIFGRTKRVSLGGKQRRLEERNPEEWIEIPGATPAIVSDQVFDAAQKALAEPKRRPNVSGRKYLLTGYLKCSCGAPLVGTCLSKTYRYYRCRSTWPTTIRPKTCDEPYIRADQLENEVWRSVREVLEQPEVILEEIRRRRDESSVHESEVTRIRSSIRRLKDQERRLVRLFGVAQITQEYVVKEVEQAKKARQALEEELSEVEKQHESMASLDSLSDQVRAFCARVAERLDEFDFDEKRLAFEALQIKVVAGRAGASLSGAIPQNLATIERTSAYVFNKHSSNHRLAFYRELKHPDSSWILHRDTRNTLSSAVDLRTNSRLDAKPAPDRLKTIRRDLTSRTASS